MAGPLAGVRVLEIASYITGPHATQLLADLGADVVKVEEPARGDPFRGGDQYRPGFLAHNRSKRSLSLDLKGPGGREILDRLIRRSQVLVQNMRPGVADRLGFGYERARELKPDIVYCSISGFGESGPYVHRPSYNDIGQALSGLSSQIMDPAQPRTIGPGFSDTITGIFASYGVLAALFAWRETGQGQHVDVNMLEATIGLISGSFTQYLATGHVEGAYHRPQASQAYAFACADGRALVIHLSSPQKFWEALVRAVGRADLLEEARFRTWRNRIERYDEITAELAPSFASRPRADWLRALDEADVPAAPIYAVDETLQDPQVRHIRVERSAHHPTQGDVRLLGSPVHLSGTPLDEPNAPPTLGEHTAAILAELGYGPEEIQQLKASGTI